MESDIINRNIETIITDECLPFMAAIKLFNSNREKKITNIICFWHKMKNLEKKLVQLHLSNDDKEKAKFLFYRIGRCPKREIVKNCIEQMKNISNELNEYVSNEIEPLLSQFSRAFIDKFTLGYNVSSLAESTNSLFKRDLKSCNYTLKDIRFEIIESFRHKAAIQKYNEYHSRKKPCILRDTYGIVVSDKIKNLLLESLLKSFRLTHQDKNIYLDPYYPDEIYKVDYPVCECNKLKFAGFPCSHIMRYSLENKINPMNLVNKRYLIDNTRTVNDWIPEMNDHEFISSSVKLKSVFYQKSHRFIIDPPKKSSFFELDKKEESMQRQALSNPVKNLNDNLPIMERYNLIMAEAKEVARRASNSEDDTKDLIQLLRNKWRDYGDTNNDFEEEIIESSGTKKGRPKLKRFKSSSENKITKKRSHCIVCKFLGLPFDHPRKQCKNSQKLIEIGKSKNTVQSGYKCSLCFGFGHNSKTCENIEILKKSLENPSNNNE